MNILTAEQTRALDRETTEETGIPGIVLMENAGIQLYNFLEDTFDDLETKKITIVCGKGNNGGDGMVLARQLSMRGNFPEVILLANTGDVSGEAAVNLHILENMDVPLVEITSEKSWMEIVEMMEDNDIIVDAILGTGIDKPLEGLYAAVIDDINVFDCFILSVDIPSGLFSDHVSASPLAVEADATVTFTAPKIAHIMSRQVSCVGELSIVPIGTPEELLLSLEAAGGTPQVLTEEKICGLTIVRPDSSYKGSYGHVGIIAGSRGKSGAATLASLAALRTGSGLVTAFLPEGIQDRVSCLIPEIMTEGSAETDTGALSLGSADPIALLNVDKNAVGIGPGLTTHPETMEVVYELIRRFKIPMVIDADALNAIAQDTDLLRTEGKPPLVLTPHPGEFARLSGLDREIILDDPIGTAASFAEEFKVWVVLKDFRTVMASPNGSVVVSPFGNPGMATAGMGDVLTGILTSVLGQYSAAGLLTDQRGVTEAICLGVGLHGIAGDIASLELGYEALTAGDVIDSLPEAYAYLEESELQ
jgi:ADP-dependent NAD(P)H-hydrate dehydratase / NAD(P)H-hydrate epimerase